MKRFGILCALLVILSGCGASRELRIQQGLAAVASGNGGMQTAIIQLEEDGVISEQAATPWIQTSQDIAERGLEATELSADIPSNKEAILQQIEGMLEVIQRSSLPDAHPLIGGTVILLRSNLVLIQGLLEE